MKLDEIWGVTCACAYFCKIWKSFGRPRPKRRTAGRKSVSRRISQKLIKYGLKMSKGRIFWLLLFCEGRVVAAVKMCPNALNRASRRRFE